MGVWSPAFQHEFLDGNILNFSAAPIAPGTVPIISFEAPHIRPVPPPDQLGFPVRRGNRFAYAFAPDTFARVIGADIKLDIVFPPGTATQQLLGNVILQNDQTVRFLLGFVNGQARIQLIVGGQFHAASVQFDPAAPLTIQARWHTHGQAHIWVNGSLRAYRPDVAAGLAFSIGSIAFGHHDTSGFATAAPAFLIRRIGVRLLRDDDALRVLDGLLPPGERPDISDECRKKLGAVDAEAMRAMRQFMTQTLARFSSPWDASQGGSPFTAEGAAAHEAAIAAGKAFIDFLAGRPAGDPALVEDQIGEFLSLIQAADPAAYAQALAALQQIVARYDATCLAELRAAGQPHAARFQPLVDLLQRVSAKMESPNG